jgi:hypothetical protein
MEVDDALSSEPTAFDQPPDPLGEFLERRTRVAPLVTTAQVDATFEKAVKTCEQKMITYLDDPEVRRKLRQDQPLFEED